MWGQPDHRPGVYGAGAVLGSGRYRVTRRLNKGATAVVYAADDLVSGCPVALKVVGCGSNKVPLNVVRREVWLSSNVAHENMVQLLDVFAEGTELIIVWELISGGDLLELLNECGGCMTETAAAFYFAQLLRGVLHMHAMGYCHRDIKPENCMIEASTQRLKLIDFGLSKHLESVATLGVGTPDYMPPEMVRSQMKQQQQQHGQPQHGQQQQQQQAQQQGQQQRQQQGLPPYDAKAVDAWAMGVVLYLLVTGCYPFEDPAQPNNLAATLLNVQAGRCQPLPEALSPSCRAAISGLLHADPTRRTRLEDLAMNPWLLQSAAAHAARLGPLGGVCFDCGNASWIQPTASSAPLATYQGAAAVAPHHQSSNNANGSSSSSAGIAGAAAGKVAAQEPLAGTPAAAAAAVIEQGGSHTTAAALPARIIAAAAAAPDAAAGQNTSSLWQDAQRRHNHTHQQHQQLLQHQQQQQQQAWLLQQQQQLQQAPAGVHTSSLSFSSGQDTPPPAQQHAGCGASPHWSSFSPEGASENPQALATGHQLWQQLVVLSSPGPSRPLNPMLQEYPGLLNPAANLHSPQLNPVLTPGLFSPSSFGSPAVCGSSSSSASPAAAGVSAQHANAPGARGVVGGSFSSSYSYGGSSHHASFMQQPQHQQYYNGVGPLGVAGSPAAAAPSASTGVEGQLGGTTADGMEVDAGLPTSTSTAAVTSAALVASPQGYQQPHWPSEQQQQLGVGGSGLGVYAAGQHSTGGYHVLDVSSSSSGLDQRGQQEGRGRRTGFHWLQNLVKKRQA